MRRHLKIFSTLLSILFLIVNIVGCGTTESSNKEVKQVEETEVAMEETVEPETVDEQNQALEAQEEDASETEEQESEQSNEGETQNNPNTSTNSSSASGNSGTTSSKSSAASTTTTKPAQPSNSQPSTSTPPTTTPVEEQKPVATVTISIVGPKDRGTILGATKMNIQDGDTVLSILLQTAKKHNIQIETRGSGSTAYVEGIDHIYEFDYGMKSGWVFTHNGASITKSIGVINIKDGDRIECYYTE